MKRDSLGRVELLVRGCAASPRGVIRRVACGGRIPFSRVAAHCLMRRERRALQRLAGLRCVPHLVDEPDLVGLPASGGDRPRPEDVLLRSFEPGEPLHRARLLPRDFFDRLDELVAAVHARGVCHNDLHKEQNVVVREDGRPALIDFQLASCHDSPSRTFRARIHDDLRHVQKHRRRYTRDGRGPAEASAARGVGYGKQRTPLAHVWRRTVKPIYVFVTRKLLRTRDGEERRPSTGPWPQWGEPVGPVGRSAD